MKNLKFILLAVILINSAGMAGIMANEKEPEEKKIIYTTMDLKRDYEVISIIAVPHDIIGTSGFRAGGPIGRAYNEAWEKFIAMAESIDADAVIGVRIELENMSQQVVGRLLLYGTAVKFTDNENESEE